MITSSLSDVSLNSIKEGLVLVVIHCELQMFAQPIIRSLSEV